MAITVMEALKATVNRYSTKSAMRFKKDDQWHNITWHDYNQTTRKIARGLAALGLDAGSYTTILSFNCKEWVFADVASIIAGSVPAGIYPTSSPEQCEYIINHCKASCVFVEDETQLKKIIQIKDQLTSLKMIVMFNGTSTESNVYSWDEVLNKAESFSESDLDKRISAQKPSDLATLVYTSGTTSNPKAVMLSHDNLTWMAETCHKYDLELSKDDLLLSYLPLSHIAEQMVSIHGPLFAGAEVAFAESIEKLGENLQEIRPTLFLGVPRVWEKIQAKMMAKGAESSPLKKKIARWAKSVGLEAGDDKEKQKSLPFKIAKKIVFSKVREALGLDRCRLQVTAAAPISRETLEFFLSLNVPLYEIFGMSECTGPGTISIPGKYKVGSTGRTVRGGEVKIADDGEVLMRGRHVFMGYLHNDEATKETIDKEGWLHSGDLGKIDADGYLYITGRKKNIIITAGGENIASEMIENKIKTIPEVEHVVVAGDRQKYLTALITLNEGASTIAKQNAINTAATNNHELSDCSNFFNYMDKQIGSLNKDLAKVQTVKKFKILNTNFTEEGGDLTPTMKLKRNVVLSKYSNEINAMYM